MKDPLTGFEYPEDWVAKCTSPEKLRLVNEGLAVLTSSGHVLRRGFTTGTTAAAAAKAAVLSLKKDTGSVCITLPCGIPVDVPASGHNGTGTAAKFAGDYPSDVTAGLEFRAEAAPAAREHHRHLRRGYRAGSPATPRGTGKGHRQSAPRRSPCIVQAVQEALDTSVNPAYPSGISAPEGVTIAQKTLNPRMGVDGGISVLGTTGLVEPWDDHLTESTTGTDCRG